MGFQWLGFPWLGYTVITLAGWLVYTELHCDYTGLHCDYTGWATLCFHWLGYTGLHWLGYTWHFSLFAQWLGCLVMVVQMASRQDSGPTYGVKTVRKLPKLLPPHAAHAVATHCAGMLVIRCCVQQVLSFMIQLARPWLLLQCPDMF